MLDRRESNMLSTGVNAESTECQDGEMSGNNSGASVAPQAPRRSRF